MNYYDYPGDNFSIKFFVKFNQVGIFFGEKRKPSGWIKGGNDSHANYNEGMIIGNSFRATQGYYNYYRKKDPNAHTIGERSQAQVERSVTINWNGQGFCFKNTTPIK